MDLPQSAIENSLVSATQAARDPLYREALWVSVAVTSIVFGTAFSEWLQSGSATVMGELLVLIETTDIYTRAALTLHLNCPADSLMEFLAGIVLGALAVLAILNSLTLCFAPEVLKPAILFKLFSLAVTVEFLSVLVLLEERAAIATLAGLSRPRAFAWVAHCALLIAAMYLVLAPMAPIHGTVGLSVAMMCFVSAADYVQDAAQRLKAAE